MAAKKKHFKDDRDRNDFYIALTVIAFFIMGGLGVAWQYQELLSESTPNDSLTMPNDQDSNAINGSMETALASDYLKPKQDEQLTRWVESTHPNLDAPTTLTKREKKDIEFIGEQDAISLVPNEKMMQKELDFEEIEEFEEEEKQNEIITPPLSKNKKISAETKGRSKAQGPQSANPVKSQKNSNYAYANKQRCLIMIGAFGKNINAEKLKQRLKKDRYQIFSKDKNGLKTVGIRVPCQGVALHQTFEKIKMKYNADAYFIDDN